MSKEDNPNNSYAVYLIRKPIDVTLSDLSHLKFTRDGTAQLKKPKLKIDDRKFSVTPGRVAGQTMLFTAESFQVDRNPGEGIQPASFVDGSLTITPSNLSTQASHDVEVPTEDLSIRPIRRQPEADIDSLKQRLYPYDMSGTSSPSEAGGGSDMCDGIMTLIKPAVLELDQQVKSTRDSQMHLAAKIQDISDLLHELNDDEDEPYDLDEYIRKIDECRRRMMASSNVLQNASDRLGILQREIAREVHSKKQTITSPPPAAPLR